MIEEKERERGERRRYMDRERREKKREGERYFVV